MNNQELELLIKSLEAQILEQKRLLLKSTRRSSNILGTRLPRGGTSGQSLTLAGLIPAAL